MVFLALLYLACLAILLWRFQSSSKTQNQKKLPPGPTPFPIVGNLFQVGKNPHQVFAKMSKKYGPLFTIRFGSILNVVVSSPELAKEVLTRPGIGNHYVSQASTALDHHNISISFLPGSSRKWRDIHKISKEQIFAHRCLESSRGLRREKLRQLLRHVGECRDGGTAVNIHSAAFTTVLNLMAATLFSAEDTEFDSYRIRELKEIVHGISTVVGVPNIADFFPMLAHFDPQSIKREAEVLFGKMFDFVRGYIDQRVELRRENPNAMKKNDFLEKLLDVAEGNEYTLDFEDIVRLLSDLFVAGTDTLTTSIEWTMAELLLHPDKLARAKDEIRTVMGDNNDMIEDSHIPRLPYLQAVIKEMFRLHPPAPLLFPRIAEEDLVMNGYFIPKDTRIIFNAWAMGRDSSIWPNPGSFEPERFLGKNIDYKGFHFELIPFGSGRRICPGLPLAHRVIHVAVATLIGNLDWEINAGEEERHRESLGCNVIQREAPLMAFPKKP